MITSDFPHIRSLVNRASGALLLYLLFIIGLAVILSVIWSMVFVISALSSGQDMATILAESEKLAFDPLLIAMTVFLSPFMAVLAALVGRSLTHVKFKPLFKPNPLNASIFAVVALAILGISFASSYLIHLIDSLLSLISLKVTPPEFLAHMPTDPLAGILVAAGICIGAPLAEEILFRGVILHALKPYGNSFAVIVSALFFGLIHGNLVQMPGAFLIGIALGIVTLHTRSLWPAIIIHAINNTTSVLLHYLFSSMEESLINILDISINVSVILLALVVTIINWRKIKIFLNAMRHRPDQSLEQGQSVIGNINMNMVVAESLNSGVSDYLQQQTKASSFSKQNTSNSAPYWSRRWYCFWTSWSTLIALILYSILLIASIKPI